MLNMMDIYEKGLSVLTENLGVVDTEQFIALIKRENFDYTKWQRKYYDTLPAGRFTEQAAEYAKTHPYTGNGIEI